MIIFFKKIELDDHWPRFFNSVKELPILETFDIAADRFE